MDIDVHRTLKEAIIAGTLQPGEPVSVGSFSEATGVNPMRVLEALMRLRAEGLVRLESRHNYVVSPISGADLAELYETRILVEGRAAGAAASRLGLTALRKMRDAMRRLREVVREGSLAAARPIAQELHFHLYDALGNHWLNSLIEHLWDQSERYHRLCIGGYLTADQVISNHEEILRAAERHDSARCEAAIIDDLAITFDGIRTQLSSNEYYRTLMWLPFTR